jgi:hypothetical protein
MIVACGDAEPKTASNSNANNSNTNNTNTNNSNTNNSELRVNMANFDQTCEFDGDCELVLPNVCGCDCSYTGINVNDLEEFSSVADAIECPTTNDACGPCLPNVVPACHQGQCVSREPFEIRAENYDVSCEQNSDCMVIYAGEICQACQCGGIAVNVTSYNANPAPEALCTPGPATCDCLQYQNARCDNNICIVES